jgi:general secretion pathway protein G
VKTLAPLGGALLLLAGCGPDRAEPTPKARAQADVAAIGDAIGSYELATFTRPTTAQGLAALVTKPDSGPIPEHWEKVMDAVPVDPWGHPYHYEQPGQHKPAFYDLWSDGPDGKSGTADDIGNWNP